MRRAVSKVDVRGKNGVTEPESPLVGGNLHVPPGRDSDQPGADNTVLPFPTAVPITARKRRKSMSRRVGQNGTVEVRNGAYRGRWFEDVADQPQRVKRSVVLGFVKEMRKTEARRKLRSIIEATGINSPSYVILSTDIFAKRVKWWEENYLSRQKPSTRKTMAYHLRKYLVPKWAKYPVDEITADRVNEWLGEAELKHL